MIHGQRTTYVKGCRCDLCRQANTAYQRKLSLHHTKAKWGNEMPLLIDSELVRQHVRMLQASGMGRRRIAEVAGVSPTVVARLLGMDHTRPATTIRPATARKLMQVQPNQTAAGAFVNATPTHRRIQALVAIGHPMSKIAALIDVTPQNFLKLLKQNQVKTATAEAIDRAYQQLHMKPGTSTRARNHAAKRKWLPPLAWDNIDDLNETHRKRKAA